VDKVYLYLKTHNQTGLKYLGKTVKDPFKYKGSGVRWRNHLKKHGDDVSTEILFESTDMEKFKEVAIAISEKYDVENSEKFANLMIEQGQGGKNRGSFKKGKVGRKITEEEKSALSESKRLYWERWREKNPNYKDKWKQNNRVRKPKDEWIVVDNVSALNKTTLTCPHCGKKNNVGNHNRWHGDNCKWK
jgi:hypothetical protein